MLQRHKSYRWNSSHADVNQQRNWAFGRARLASSVDVKEGKEEGKEVHRFRPSWGQLFYSSCVSNLGEIFHRKVRTAQASYIWRARDVDPFTPSTARGPPGKRLQVKKKKKVRSARCPAFAMPAGTRLPFFSSSILYSTQPLAKVAPRKHKITNILWQLDSASVFLGPRMEKLSEAICWRRSAQASPASLQACRVDLTFVYLVL